MTKLPVLLAVAAGVALASCDNSTPPTKAAGEVNQNPQVDKNPVPQSSTGGDQQGTPPKQ